MGGYVSFEIWRQAPERVKVMILCDTKHRLDNPDRVKLVNRPCSWLKKENSDQMAKLFHGMLTAQSICVMLRNQRC